MLMSSSFMILVTLFTLDLSARMVLASGVFEINLDQFFNEAGLEKNGKCCDGNIIRSTEICSKPCRTAFHVCFTHFQSALGHNTPCTFGSFKTSVLGFNTLDTKNLPRENPIKLKFNFTWPGTFSLVIEARHVKEKEGSSDEVIARIVKRGNVAVNQDWRTETQTQNEKILRYSYRVRCDMHYYGGGCSEYCRPRDDIYGHYTCDRNGAKICLPGWQGSAEGTYCRQPICLPGCNTTHGYCTSPKECICRPGWRGTLCNECRTYPGCAHGTCEKKYDCNCDPGWGGMFCNQDLNYCTNHKPCKNNARCTNVGQGSFACDCPPGFTDRDCGTEIDECNPNPCQNGGQCTGQETGGYICKCLNNFFGMNCEKTHVTCSSQPCLNSGTCVDEISQYICHCKSGFRGINCQTRVVLCSPSTCQNGGTCINNAFGPFCQCPNGFSGERCEISKCRHNLCRNGGKCVSTINGYKCNCSHEFTGTHCERIVSNCQKNLCLNGGKCNEDRNGYTCECPDGFSGVNCMKMDQCYTMPCKNQGTCVDHGLYYTCDCKLGYRGNTCEILVDEKSASLVGFSKSKSAQFGFGSRKDTRIILLTKNDKMQLNSSQWIAVCLGSGLLVLIFVAVAVCVAYHRRSKSSYTNGRILKTLQLATNPNKEQRVPNKQPETLYSSHDSKFVYVAAENALPISREYTSEIVVVPSSYLPSTKRNAQKNEVGGPRIQEKRSSLIVASANDLHQQARYRHDSMKCQEENLYNVQPHAYHEDEMTAFLPSNRIRSSNVTRQSSDRLRLPTYQEACKEVEALPSEVV